MTARPVLAEPSYYALRSRRKREVRKATLNLQRMTPRKTSSRQRAA